MNDKNLWYFLVSAFVFCFVVGTVVDCAKASDREYSEREKAKVDARVSVAKAYAQDSCNMSETAIKEVVTSVAP